MITLRSDPRPSSYSCYVIQVMSAAWGDWCDYAHLDGGTTQRQAEGDLEMVRKINAGYEFRLVNRQINDTLTTE